MKRGITIERGRDRHEMPILIIRKKRGQLTLSEIEDILRYEDCQQWNGLYAILLNCSEDTMGGNGCFDILNQPMGDNVILHDLEDDEHCPICASMLPPFRYCPTCGTSWENQEQNIETLLAHMQAEARRGIENPDSRMESRVAWYWSHIGSIDLAYQLGLITEERRLALYEEMKAVKPDMQPQAGTKEA